MFIEPLVDGELVVVAIFCRHRQLKRKSSSIQRYRKSSKILLNWVWESRVWMKLITICVHHYRFDAPRETRIKIWMIFMLLYNILDLSNWNTHKLCSENLYNYFYSNRSFNHLFVRSFVQLIVILPKLTFPTFSQKVLIRLLGNSIGFF